MATASLIFFFKDGLRAHLAHVGRTPMVVLACTLLFVLIARLRKRPARRAPIRKSYFVARPPFHLAQQTTPDELGEARARGFARMLQTTL